MSRYKTGYDFDEPTRAAGVQNENASSKIIGIAKGAFTERRADL